MQGRFGAAVVDEDAYILKLSRYVHLNPVFTKEHERKTKKERIQEQYRRLVDAAGAKEDVSFRHEAQTHDVSEIIAVVCDAFRVRPEDLRRRRRESLVRPAAAKVLC